MPQVSSDSFPPALASGTPAAAPSAPGFVHLHVHSEFSLLSGVPSVPDLVGKAKALGLKALALTDTNRMSGLILFYNECMAQGIRPILGTELEEARHPGETVVLLARNARGYGDICELITRRQLQGKAFSFAEAFAREWPDLFLLTAFPRCLGILAAGPNRRALYGELVRHCPATRARGREMEALCAAEGLPVAASQDARFLMPGDHELHRVLRAIDLNSTLSRLREGETAPPGAWLSSPMQMEDLFPDRPDALANAGAIASQCDTRLELGRWIMPEIAVPKGYTPDTWLARLALRGLWRKYGGKGGEDAGKPAFAEARKIQKMELEVIRKLGYSSYFLMVKRVRDWASGAFRSAYRRPRDCSILRGSGANSITFYNLGVCNLDPIALGLYFQRFLNEDRASPPDADLDFGWDERERVLAFVAREFGRDRVAITCTTNRFRGNGAFRETAKVFGYADGQITEVLDSYETNARRIDDEGIRRVRAWARRIQGKPRFLGQHPGGLIITNGPIWRHVACEWSRIGSADSSGVGEADSTMPRGRPGGGAAGATAGRISAATPGEPAGDPRGRIVTQVDMHSGIDDLGLIKFDLLGNGSLSVLRDTLDQLHEQGIPDPEVWDLKKCFGDPEVRDMLVEGRTRGIFYIESPAQIRLNQRARAGTFPEIVITSSLVRPAGTAYAKTFVERHRALKVGIRDWEFLHPSLEGILGETHDVCAFQEDVIRICHEVAGLSYKQADRIRKMMNSQHEGAPAAAEWDAVRRAFVAGCGEKSGMGPDPAEALWKRVASFTGFSFCKSHSASYAELSFQCSHLKARHPAQFLAAVISNRHGYYTRGVYLDEARRWGLRILPMDVNASRLKYHGRDKWIRPGLTPLRNCRDAALTALVREREENGPFRDLIDLLQRTEIHKREAEALILAGACGGFGMTQPELLYLLDGAYAKVKPDQADLFASPQGWETGLRGLETPAPAGGQRGMEKNRPAPGRGDFSAYNKLEDYPLMRKCLNELNLLGYVLSADLLHVVEFHPAAAGAVRAADLGAHVGRRVKVLGMAVTDRMHPVARSGRSMKFLTLGDNTGYVDVIFWPDALDRWNDDLAGQVPFSGNLLEVTGRVNEDWGTYSLEADFVRVVGWLPNQVDMRLVSRGLERGMRRYPAYAGDALAA